MRAPSRASHSRLIIIVAALLFTFSKNLSAQLVVTPNPSIATLMAALAGQGLTVTNVTLNCPAGAYGTFNGTASNIGLANGILLTTGNVNNAVGPNNSTSASTCNGTIQNDPQLTAIEPQAVNDLCVLEFDIVPQCSTLQIRFVFGSEEYPEFVNSSFNDAFGFFITGPGPNCGGPNYNNTNVATLPNNVTPVTIDNVNATTNNTYYFNNTGGTTVQYDGFTVALTRNVSLCPCATYHFKIAIADAGDCVYDSGVFLDFIACQTVLTATSTSLPASCTCTGSATATGSGSIGPYTYSWVPSNQTNQTATGLCAGTYTCYVNDALTCTPAVTTTVTVTGSSSSLILTPSQTNVLCNGQCNGSASVVASGAPGPYTYNWSPSGGTNATATGLCAGTYTVTVTASNGCTGTQAFTITQPPLLTATQSQVNVLCNGQCTGTASVVASGGTPGYTYTWTTTPVQYTATATGLCAGSYTVTIRDANGCTITRTFTITQPPALAATQSQVNILCNGQCTGTATVVASGGTPAYTYTWTTTPVQNTSTATGLCAGSYTVTIRDANGCTITRTFTITQPPALTATQSQVNVLCNGQCTGSASVVVSGGTAPYTYNWTPSGGISATASGLCAGTYTCTITDANGCTITRTFTITQPPALTATQSQVNVLCNGQCTGTATVVASGGTPAYTYTWTTTPVQNAATATGLCAGSYTVTIRDANGCTITRTFTITQPPALTATQSQVNILCSGQCTGSASVVVSGGTPAYTYNWAPSGGNTANATGLCAGTYTCTVTDANGCTIVRTFTITQPASPLTATQSQVNILCNGQCNGSASVVASGGTPAYTYNWAPSGGNTANATGLCAGTYTCTITDANGCTITRTFTITQPPALTATQSQVNVLCNGQCTGSASVVVSGGTPAYTYNWTPSGGNTANATGLCAGTYTCTVTDANGCTVVRTFTITQPPALTITTSSTQAICGQPNGTATVTASGGTPAYSYNWAPSGGTNANATGLTAGSYTITVTDANGCTATATVVVPAAGGPTVTIPTQVNVSCFGGSNGSANSSVSGGTAPYTYNWTPSGGTNANATGLSAGSYTITVTDANGCTSVATVTITQPTQLTATQSQVNVSCNGSCNGSATVVASGGTPGYTYNWAPSGGNAATATGLCAGTYTCTITDANGCTITQTFTLTQPLIISVIAAQNNVTCNGQCNGSAQVVVSGGVPPYTYNWAPSGGTNSQASNLCAGTYTVTITDANGCTRTQAFTITQPPALTATTSSVQSTCGQPNGSATVTAGGGTPGYTYNWAPSGGTNATATGLLAGNYTVTITDANGCTITATVTVNNAGGPTVTISSSVNVSCFGGNNGSANTNVTGGSAPYTYIWSPSGGTGANATGLSAGNYTVTVTDANGCTSSTSVTITQPAQLTASISASTNVSCNGGNNGTATVTASGGTPAYSYNWTPSGGTGATATGLTAGSYTVTITDANGCTTTATVTITQPGPLAVTQAQTNVSCNAGCNGTATVTASGGTPAYTYNWAPSGGSAATASGLCAGTYTCTITDANGCTITSIFTITQPAALSLSTSFVQSTCGQPNGSASVVATGGTPAYSYSWAPSGGSGANATGLLAGSYTVFVTDANGCSATATVVVPNAGSPTATISASTNVSCFNGNDGSATVTITGGTSPYTIAWSPSGGTSTTATGLSAGNYTVTVTDANGCTVTATVTITQPPLLTANISSSTNVLCFGGNNGSATVTAAGGTTPYSYNWTPSGGTNATATGLTAGNYTVTVTDMNGCTAIATVTITEPTQLVLAVAGFNATCNGACDGQGVVIPSGGTPNYTYSWAPSGGTNPSATGLCIGTYTVYVTDANGCTASDTAIVNEPTPIVIATTFTTAYCGQSDGSACANVSGGIPPYTYAWNPSSQTGNCASAIPAGTYTVTVTDFNGCTATATVVVPNTPGVVASISASTMVSCFGACDGTAIATGTGGNTPYTYAWAPSGGNAANATGLCAGTYTCTITDANGCTDTAVVVITQPSALTVTTTQVDVLCNGVCSGTATANPSGGTAPYTYSWSNGQLTQTATGLCAGSYDVYVTDANNCSHMVSVTIVEPTAVIASATASPAVICIGANSTLTGSANGGTPGYTYSWWAPINATGSTATVTPTATIVYTLSVTDANGCVDTTTVTVTVNPLPAISFTSNPTPAVGCAPLCVDFTNTTPNGVTCFWDFQVATSNNCNTTQCYQNAGTYDVTLTVTDNNGCVNTLTMPAYVTVYPNPVADFSMSPQPTTILNGTIQFTDLSQGNPTQWDWSFGDVLNSSSTDQHPAFTYTDTGNFQVQLIVTTQYGCSDTAIRILRIDPDFVIFVPNAFTPNDQGPNNTFYPQGMGVDENRFKMWIFDRWGNNIWFTETWGKGWDGRANDGEDIAQIDVYVWKIVLYDIFGVQHSYVGHVSLIK